MNCIMMFNFRYHYTSRLLVGTYVKGIIITIIKGGKTGVIFWSKVYLSI